MLGWIRGQEEQVADNSKVLEPPETPGPVFAIRAFKSALFGTPAAADDVDDEDTGNRAAKTKIAVANQRLTENVVLKPTQDARDVPRATKADLDLAVNAMASPTKSILMTPGTVSNRRKTVSFGESVVDNERQRDDLSAKYIKTPANISNSFSSQWSAGSSASKPRSKLTQALLDSREGSEKGTDVFVDSTSSTGMQHKMAQSEEDDNDDTINLDEPRSQSGKYWKAEYDNYRNKTTWEIKKLIQYRSAAKTYAKKKDEEASRLAEKLREEEIKVAEMERHVTHLASTMVGESANADKEKLVQELTKQTALALQYKHRVYSLRKTLERHGVVGQEVADAADTSGIASPSEQKNESVNKIQQALDQANAKIEEMKRQQEEFNKLKDLARTSEHKASELQKENASLKQTLARVKQEMSKYEGRRKEKEAKLKQREVKLETRIQEYRERLKSASQQHRQHEEELKESFSEERRRMQEQVDQLRIKLTAIERLPQLQSRVRHSESPGKDHTGVHVYDFGAQASPEKEALEETVELDEPPSPSPRAKERRSYPSSRYTAGDLDLKRAMRAMGISDEDQVAFLGGETRLAPHSRYRPGNGAAVPPSSPPEYPPLDAAARSRPKHKYNTDSYRNTHPPPSKSTITSLAHHLAQNLDDSHQIRTTTTATNDRLRIHRPSKYGLDAISGVTESHAHNLDRNSKRKQTLAAVHRDSIPLDRKLSAQARLKQRKDESRKSKEQGKENIRVYTSQPLSALEA
ncbi:uncharacterized protein BP01DRAFT_304339 [Aspergillus saccharolyticus JOP 1030-1]|uniref:Spindle pole body-associated protein cut12 domain-containing protein n=1 Tax=Aspergillus saccharolyticus JOP 1030-1 TaxID=1450539 RepID=A0A319A3I0_9EURO|nr:hypothetical protein BP01DRAFT_304339 [Aspergillus saccharolyticus JOP 1030-1]PYH42012.1 hypothetical protein BP01DRAFT_304339 [Aspergillus saccharolyticus JOP 1030-1]